ncbi:MAG: pantoate--beta-alanine ligase [Flavobacteriales bacterium]|nr:pantoate--beta-alanine ligase [Flavobacteriales bacterium]
MQKIKSSKYAMEVFKTVKEIQEYLVKTESKNLGFVATMGALHQAHISLIELSQKENELTVCSIFVNPKQFNKKEDLVKYPRDTEADLKKLEAVNCDIVFIPSVEEMYPKKVEREFHFGILSEVMEAEHRPGHFNGVAIVIERFFEILNPTHAYFGKKDYQQLAVIKALTKQINSSVKIVGCPIYREKNGLAMSSRNERLSANEKEEAGVINKTLKYVCEHKNLTVPALKTYFLTEMNQHLNFESEYFEIVDEITLQPIQEWGGANKYIAFTAVNVNGVRLIDNMTIIN